VTGRPGPVGGPSLSELLARPRFEVIPLRGLTREIVHLPPGATVAVTCSPHRGVDHTLDVAEGLARAGFRAVPHVAARLVRGRGHLEEILGRIRHAGMQEAFVIGGDVVHPRGPYGSAGELLEAMAGMGHGLEEIGIGGYPEGHPLIDDGALLAALLDKQRFATYLVTQMCFHPAAVFDWIAGVRRRGIHLPVYVGLPGAVRRRKLLEVSLRIGVGDSVRYLTKHGSLVARLVGRGAYRPDAFVAGASPFIPDPGYGLRGFHIYTFNQIESTEMWRRLAVGGCGSAGRRVFEGGESIA